MNNYYYTNTSVDAIVNGVRKGLLDWKQVQDLLSTNVNKELILPAQYIPAYVMSDDINEITKLLNIDLDVIKNDLTEIKTYNKVVKIPSLLKQKYAPTRGAHQVVFKNGPTITLTGTSEYVATSWLSDNYNTHVLSTYGNTGVPFWNYPMVLNNAGFDIFYTDIGEYTLVLDSLIIHGNLMYFNNSFMTSGVSDVITEILALDSPWLGNQYLSRKIRKAFSEVEKTLNNLPSCE
jgi:hypothetical protein